MYKKVLILINICLIVVLAFIAANFYLLIEDDSLEKSRQYTLVISDYGKPISNEKSNVVDNLNTAITENGFIINNETFEDNSENIKAEKDLRLVFSIIDLGINSNITKQSINEFPSDVTLGFAIHSNNLIGSVSGNDIMLSLPIGETEESKGVAIDNALTKEENIKRLSFILSQIKDHYAGIYTQCDQVLAFDIDIINKIMTELSERNKFIYCSNSNTAMEYLAKESNLGFVTPDLIIKYDFNKEMINDRLKLIEQIHKLKNDIVVLVEASPIAIETLKNFIEQEHNFRIVRTADLLD